MDREDLRSERPSFRSIRIDSESLYGEAAVSGVDDVGVGGCRDNVRANCEVFVDHCTR